MDEELRVPPVTAWCSTQKATQALFLVLLQLKKDINKVIRRRGRKRTRNELGAFTPVSAQGARTNQHLEQ